LYILIVETKGRCHASSRPARIRAEGGLRWLCRDHLPDDAGDVQDRRDALRPKGEETRQWFTTVARIVADFCSGVCFELRAYNIAASPSSASAKCPSSLALASNADITGGKIACGLGGRRGGFQFFQ
jgi:hypothetical protein